MGIRSKSLNMLMLFLIWLISVLSIYIPYHGKDINLFGYGVASIIWWLFEIIMRNILKAFRTKDKRLLFKTLKMLQKGLLNELSKNVTLITPLFHFLGLIMIIIIISRNSFYNAIVNFIVIKKLFILYKYGTYFVFFMIVLSSPFVWLFREEINKSIGE